MKKIIYVMAALLLTACNPFGGTPGNPNPTGSPVGDENPAQIQELGSPSAEQKGPATGEVFPSQPTAAPAPPQAPSETATTNAPPPDSTAVQTSSPPPRVTYSCGATVPVVKLPDHYGLVPPDWDTIETNSAQNSTSKGQYPPDIIYAAPVQTFAGQDQKVIIQGETEDADTDGLTANLSKGSTASMPPIGIPRPGLTTSVDPKLHASVALFPIEGSGGKKYHYKVTVQPEADLPTGDYTIKLDIAKNCGRLPTLPPLHASQNIVLRVSPKPQCLGPSHTPNLVTPVIAYEEIQANECCNISVLIDGLVKDPDGDSMTIRAVSVTPNDLSASVSLDSTVNTDGEHLYSVRLSLVDPNNTSYIGKTYTIAWEISDTCGNKASASFAFTALSIR